jgi:hypothetical protein
MKVHHNTLKRAIRAGIELVVDGDMVNAVTHEGKVLARHADPKEALETALRELNGGAAPKRVRKSKAPKPSHEDDAGDEDEGSEDELSDEELGLDEGEGDEEKESHSVVKPKYRKKYRPHRHTCGDGLTRQIAEAFMTKLDPDSKKPKIDWPRFVKFAKANDCWVGAYASLNHGMARMNVANRLRARVKKGEEIIWNID